MLTALNGDAGFRQYFRTNTEPSLIAVSAPPAQENNPAFVSKALAFRASSIHVPEIYAVDFFQGFMLLEDLGDELILPRLSMQTAPGIYGAAEQALIQLQQVPADTEVFDAYSANLLEQEMTLFPQWFVERLLGLSLSHADESLLREVFGVLVNSARAQPQVVVHRDYHSRNLLLATDGGIAMVDFQDAVIGPMTYDLVSLLRDCYIRWPADWVRERALGFAKRSGALLLASEAQFLRWFDLMGLQRHIKVLGIFARLSLRDNKPQYLHDIPLVIRYTLEAAMAQSESEPVLSEFVAWFERVLIPALEGGQQQWYRPWQTAGEQET